MGTFKFVNCFGRMGTSFEIFIKLLLGEQKMKYKFEILAVSCVYFQQNIDTCFNNNIFLFSN